MLAQGGIDDGGPSDLLHLKICSSRKLQVIKGEERLKHVFAAIDDDCGVLSRGMYWYILIYYLATWADHHHFFAARAISARGARTTGYPGILHSTNKQHQPPHIAPAIFGIVVLDPLPSQPFYTPSKRPQNTRDGYARCIAWHSTR